MLVALYGGHVRVSVGDSAEERVGSTLAWLRERLPPSDPSSAHEITVTFWTYGPHGPMPSWRAISVPSWDEIRENYGGQMREHLEPLMHGFQPARGGQLVLWHGLAGTGKTFALRSLGWEWRDWCEFHYIVDPMHPAVARPGRCAANVRFLPLSREESERWLAERGSSAAVRGPTTLASLYALAEGPDPGDAVDLVGFAG